MNWFIDQEVELTKGAIAGEKRTNITPLAYPGSANAHQWRVYVKNHGIPLDLTGNTVTAYFQRSDGNVVVVQGATIDNMAYVIIPAEVYAISGIVKAYMDVVLAGTAITPVAGITFNVPQNMSGDIIDPGEVIPASLEELLAEIDAMRQATAEARAVINSSVRYDTAQTLTDAQKERARGNIDAASVGDVGDLRSALSFTTVLSPIWERGNINSSGENVNSGRYVRSASAIIVNSDTLHIEFDGAYSSYPLYTVFIYGDTVSRISKVASADISLTPGSSVRFVIATGSNDTETVIQVENADQYLAASYEAYYNVVPDKTLSIPDRPADAKATGDAIAAKGEEIIADILDDLLTDQDVTLTWEHGNVSSNGNNSQSSSTTVIRTPNPPVQIGMGTTLYYEVPNSLKLKLVLRHNDTWTETNNLTGNGSFDIAESDAFRLALLSVTSGTDVEPSEGNGLRLYYKTRLSDTVSELVDIERRNVSISYMSFSIFEKFGVIGDSFASGSIHHPDDGGWTGNYQMSWPQILARATGSTAVNFTKGGLSTKTWLADTTYGLSALLAEDPQQLYIIALGINDNTQINAGTLALGTIDDVNVLDYTQNPDTFFGNYGRIIGNIMAHAPYAKIVCLSVARLNERNMDTYIQQIADKYSLPFIDLTSDPYFVSTIYYGSLVSAHPLVYGYAGMANAIARLICLDVLTNTTYWGTYYGLVEEDHSVNPEG